MFEFDGLKSRRNIGKENTIFDGNQLKNKKHFYLSKWVKTLCGNTNIANKRNKKKGNKLLTKFVAHAPGESPRRRQTSLKGWRRRPWRSFLRLFWNLHNATFVTCTFTVYLFFDLPNFRQRAEGRRKNWQWLFIHLDNTADAQTSPSFDRPAERKRRRFVSSFNFLKDWCLWNLKSST